MNFSTTLVEKKQQRPFLNTVANLFKFFTPIFFLLPSCVTRLPTPNGIKDISLSDYENRVQEKTRKVLVYNGFTNELNIFATALDTDMTEAYLSHSARLFQWSESVYRDEKNKITLKQGSETIFFVSFFTPDRKNDNLSLKNSSWKVFLDVDGIRFEGKVSKIKRNLSELQTFYPHHNRWYTGYNIEFPIATSLSENKRKTLTFTGALGSSQLIF